MGGHAPPLTVAAAVAMRPREWDALMAPRIPPTHPPWGSEQRRRAVYSRRQQYVLHLHGVLHPGGALGCAPSRRGHLASSTVGGEALGPPPPPSCDYPGSDRMLWVPHCEKGRGQGCRQDDASGCTL